MARFRTGYRISHRGYTSTNNAESGLHRRLGGIRVRKAVVLEGGSDFREIQAYKAQKIAEDNAHRARMVAIYERQVEAQLVAGVPDGHVRLDFAAAIREAALQPV